MHVLTVEEIGMVDGAGSLQTTLEVVGGGSAMLGGLEMMAAAVTLGPLAAGAMVFIGGAVLISTAIN